MPLHQLVGSAKILDIVCRPPFVWCLDKEAAWPTKLPRQLAFNKALMTGLQRDRIAENHKNMLNITLKG